MRLLILLFVSLTLSGCSMLSVFKSPPREVTTIRDWMQDEVVTPIMVGIDKDGNTVIANRIERHYATSQSVTNPKLTFMQRIGRAISGLSWTAAIFILISLLFFGGAPILWAVKKYYTLRNAFKNTVKGIRDMPPEIYDGATNVLAKTQNESDKKLVDKIKSELH